MRAKRAPSETFEEVFLDRGSGVVPMCHNRARRDVVRLDLLAALKDGVPAPLSTHVRRPRSEEPGPLTAHGTDA